MESILDLVNVSVSFSNESRDVLSCVNVTFSAGEHYVILGQSGSGKSTLLHILALLDHPTSGSVLFCNQDVQKLSNKERALLRNRAIGFVYQSYNLLYDFSSTENVAMPLIIAGESNSIAFEKANHLLDAVGLTHKINCSCKTMSGGEQQRVAIARAIINNPQIIIADEPTGNLDDDNGEQILQLLIETAMKCNSVLIMATHNSNMASAFSNKLLIRNKTIERI